MKAYGAEPSETEEIGFRLPERERVEHPWNDGEKEEAPGRDASDVADPAPEGLDAPEQQLPEDGGKHRAPGGWDEDETGVIPRIGDDEKKD